MTPSEFANKMQLLKDQFQHDPESCHAKQDDLLLECLEYHGYSEGVKIWRTSPGWYA